MTLCVSHFALLSMVDKGLHLLHVFLVFRVELVPQSRMCLTFAGHYENSSCWRSVGQRFLSGCSANVHC